MRSVSGPRHIGRGRTCARVIGVLCTILVLTSAATDTPTAGRSSDPRTVYAVPADVARDCSDDVTAALTDFIQRVPDHSTIRFAHGGCYRVEGTLEFLGRNGLVIDGRHATIRATTTGDDSRS